MQRDPAKMAYGYAQSKRAARDEEPMSMLEAAIFFGVLSLIIDGIGAVIARVTGIPFLLFACLGGLATTLIIMVTGFVAARYTATINGVWAGVMVAAINSVFGQLIFIAALPEYRELMLSGSQTGDTVGTASAIGMALGVVIGAIGTIIGGAFFGFIGAAFAQLGIFRPKVEYIDEY
jgi:hypothetical protein